MTTRCLVLGGCIAALAAGGCTRGPHYEDFDSGVGNDAVAPDSGSSGIDGTEPDGSSEPTPLTSHVATGAGHTCSLVGTAVRCWGNGGYGRLGYGNTANVGDNETPASIGDVNVGAAIASIVTGNNHSCALTTTGAVRCWGWGMYGQLGYASTNDVGDNEAPFTVGDVNVGGTVIQLAAGRAHTCALLAGGTVRCWGFGSYGALGYGSTNHVGDGEVPMSAGDIDVGGTVIQITAGAEHTCALLSNGSVRCWGLGTLGRLGYGNATTIGDTEAPASAGNVDVGGIVIQVAAGGAHTCAVLSNETVRCWGANASGELGLGSISVIGDNEAPSSAPAINVGGTVSLVETGLSHTCTILQDGSVLCWGEGDFGRLGYGDPFDVGDNEHPFTKGDVDAGPVVELALGSAHTCGRLDDGNVRCWGEGDDGRLGYADTNDVGDNETPASKGNVPYQ